MATKAKSASSESAHVTRISAVDSKAPKNKAVKAAEKKTKTTSDAPKSRKGILKPIFALAGYFKGAWQELRQVRWPNRKATWSLTLAVLAFTAFFTVLILLLDALYKFLFELILK